MSVISSPVPFCIIKEDGSIRNCAKAEFMHILETLIPGPNTIPRDKADQGAELAQLVGWMTLNQEVPSSNLAKAI